MPTAILLSDTNLILKLVLFEKFDLCDCIIPGYGEIKFHPMVEAEIVRWITNFYEGKKGRVVDKFGIEVLRVAIKRTRANLQKIEPLTEEDKNLRLEQYESVFNILRSNSALPSENDLLLLLHADEMGCYMVTNDDIIYKMGKKIIGEKSLQIEDIFKALFAAELITREEVKDYSALLGSYQESFNLSKIFK